MESISLTRALTDGDPEADGDRRGIKFIIASSARARDGHRIDLAGMDTRGFSKNPVMLYGHASRDLPIGTWSNLEMIEGKIAKLRAVADFVSADLNPFADAVYRLAKAKVLRMASIGWRTIAAERDPELQGDAYGLLFTRTELLEASIVPVGADPLAMSGARALVGVDAVRELRAWADASIALWPAEFGHRDELVAFARAFSEPIVAVPAPMLAPAPAPIIDVDAIAIAVASKVADAMRAPAPTPTPTPEPKPEIKTFRFQIGPQAQFASTAKE